MAFGGTLAKKVAGHYGTGHVLQRIDAALRRLGVHPGQPTVEDLKPVDEFHTGGLEATEALIEQLDLSHADRVLDIGCGIGGTVRHIVSRCGCEVTGVDLTVEYIETARILTQRVGLADRAVFEHADATALDFDDDRFDVAVMFHVGMNIPDKAQLFAEIGRVLRPGGRFALFDVMRGEAAGPLDFPLPWASHPAFSFVEPSTAYHAAARAAGFEMLATRARRDFALAYFARVFAMIEESGVPPLGIHLLMGETAGAKLNNYVDNVEKRRIVPTEFICRRL